MIVTTATLDHATVRTTRGYPDGGAPDQITLEIDQDGAHTTATFTTAEFREFVHTLGFGPA